MTPAERKAKSRAVQREARVAAGAPIPTDPLAPIEQRRLLNELKGYLSGFDFDDLKKVKAFIERDIFRSQSNSAPDIRATLPHEDRGAATCAQEILAREIL
jgi:hypothetical protein